MKNVIQWLGHATILIRGEKTVMVDPWKVPPSAARPVDLVLVTHDHYDHCSPDDVARVSGPATQVLAPSDAAAKLGPAAQAISPGEVLAVSGVAVEAVPAYNLNKQFHPKVNGWLGYVVTLGGERIYVAGDTDRTPEMDEVKADVAVVPVGGTYTMTADAAVNRMKPLTAVPIHFGDIVGSKDDANRFAALCDVPVKILTPPGQSACLI